MKLSFQDIFLFFPPKLKSQSIRVSSRKLGFFRLIVKKYGSDRNKSSSGRGSDELSSRYKHEPRELREHYREQDRRKDRDHRHSDYRNRYAADERRDYGSRDNDSKRTSGFDMAPPTATFLPSAPVSGQLPGLPLSMPGLLQNMFAGGTPQATRHAG